MFDVVVFLIVLLCFQLIIAEDSFPTCGDCWCVPGNNGYDSCPYSLKPQTSFPDITIDTYKKQGALNFYTIGCNPYMDNNCQTSPAQEYLDVDTAVCAFVYPAVEVYHATGKTGSGLSCSEYYLQSFPSREAAEKAGAVVTHDGSCGLCSTTIDLAIYLTEDFTQSGKVCATKGTLNETDGLLCYQSLGLTLECAKIWNYDGIYDSRACAKDCVGSVTAPNNGPAPACELNPCLECDEEKAGPIFSTFAGRTRRRSGLLSEIVRSCDSIAKNITHDPCTNPVCQCR